MPKTHFDCIQSIRPEFLEDIKKDVKYLIKIGRETPVLSVDEYNSRFSDCITREVEKYFEMTARTMGVPTYFLRENLNSFPDFVRNRIAVAAHNLNHEYHSCINFLLAGKKTFFFSDVVSQNLVHTEINLPATEIQLPFFACQLVFTEREIIDAFYTRAIKDNPNLKIDYSCPISVFVTLHNDCDGLDGRRIIINSQHSKFPDTLFMGQKRELFLGNSWSLEQSLKTDWEKLTPDNLGTGLNYSNNNFDYSTDEQFYTDGLLFHRIVMNAILYIISKNSDFLQQNSSLKELEKRIKNTKSFPKKVELEREIKNISVLDYFEVGINENPIVIKQNNGGDKKVDIAYENFDRKIIRRFMVRGHWRNQRCGTGLTETKLIWIKPYIKGDDLSEMINKPYVVV